MFSSLCNLTTIEIALLVIALCSAGSLGTLMAIFVWIIKTSMKPAPPKPKSSDRDDSTQRRDSAC